MAEDQDVRFLFESPENKNFIYKPTNKDTLEAKRETLAVKFSNNIYLAESFLEKYNIKYTPEDLEYTPLGPCVIIKPEDQNKNEWS